MEAFQILFVDDDRDILEIVEDYLSKQGYAVTAVDNGLTALELVRDRDFDVVFTDYKMPDFTGLDLLAAIKEYRPDTEVIIVTGYGTMESAVKAMKFGSYDYLQKPFKLETLKILIDKISEEKRLRKERIVLKNRVKDRHRYDELVGMSLRLQEIYETVEKSSADGPNVVIQGESGTGKKLLARVIHKKSRRRDSPFIPVNCSSIAKGASGNALSTHLAGLFEAARGGTIFLDEIADIAPRIQDGLLKAFSAKGTSSGAEVPLPEPELRVVAATNRDSVEAMAKGVIREDFFAFLNEVSFTMPPLRERKEDICLLINQFLYEFNAKSAKKVLGFTPQAMDILLSYHWPGNVIQLENVIERAFALGVEGAIDVPDLPHEISTFGEIFH